MLAGRHLAWLLKLVAGLLIFWLAFRDVDPTAVGRAFALVKPAWLTAAVLSVFLTVGLVTARWSALLGAGAGQRHTPVLFAAVIASQVANIVVPFRLGDAVRISAVSRTLGIPPAEVLSSVAIERLFDALLVAVTAGLLAALGALPPFAHAGMLSLALGIGAGLVCALLLVRFRSTFDGALTNVARLLPERPREWIGRQIDFLLRGLNRVTQPGPAAAAFAWSATVMGGSILTAWLVLRAVGVDAPALSAAVVVIAVQIGSVVVPIPGAVGISQVITVQTLRLWDVPEAPALAYALMLYLVARVPKLAVLPIALVILNRAAAAKPQET